jgi:small subunit ribosomal protein S10e
MNIPSLHCFLVMRSLRSRKFVTEIFSWQWHYYFLTAEGIKYLREYLGLPSNVIPNTHKADRNVQKQEEGEAEGEGETRGRGGRGRGRGGRGRGRGRGDGEKAGDF